MKSIVLMGGLGNQMFQYALFISSSMKYNDLKCDLSWFSKNDVHNGFELQKIFQIKKIEISSKKYFSDSLIKNLFRKIQKKINGGNIVLDNYKFNENLFKLKKTNIFYIGYWQSENYFSENEKKIREIYKFPKILDKKNLELIERIKDRQSVSIHVRRGDYVGHPYLDGMAPSKYYRDAICYIKSKIVNPIFLIFSNDMNWCINNLDLSKDEVIYVDWNLKENSFRDMQLMSLCNHNIIPNSSFSWWGAWLNKNPNKIVIAPEKWFTFESKLDCKDIIPKSWIKIKNY